MVDASRGGTFMMKTEDEGWDLFETLSENSQHYASTYSGGNTPTLSKSGGLYEVGESSYLSAKVDDLSRKLDSVLSLGQVPSYSLNLLLSRRCASCVLIQAITWASSSWHLNLLNSCKSTWTHPMGFLDQEWPLLKYKHSRMQELFQFLDSQVQGNLLPNLWGQLFPLLPILRPIVQPLHNRHINILLRPPKGHHLSRNGVESHGWTQSWLTSASLTLNPLPI